MADGSSEERRLSRGRRVGRRVGQVVYYALVGAFATAATWQVTQQIFFPKAPDVPVTVSTCEGGIRVLLDGIDAAKQAAARHDGDGDEEAALNRFRRAISPVWAQRDAIGAMCPRAEHKALLDAIDRLRYSEEHGVRKQAAELAALRRRVGDMAAEVVPQPPAE